MMFVTYVSMFLNFIGLNPIQCFLLQILVNEKKSVSLFSRYVQVSLLLILYSNMNLAFSKALCLFLNQIYVNSGNKIRFFVYLFHTRKKIVYCKKGLLRLF